MPALETSFSRPHPSRIFGWPRGRKWRTTPWNIAFSTLPKSHFGLEKGEENVFAVIGDHLKYRFLDIAKVEFWSFKRKW